MELRHLRYFVAVATDGNFGRAARRLNVSQPALTRQIHDLERELGVRLFDRTPRGVELTPSGRSFLVGAEDTIAAAQHAMARARAAERDVVGRISIGHVRPDAHVRLLSPILRTLHERYPLLDVHLAYMSTGDQWGAIRDWQLDVGISYDTPPASLNLASEKLEEAPLTGVLLPDDHPLLAGHALQLRDLAPFPLIMFPRALNEVCYDRLLTELAARGVRPEVIQEGASISLSVATRPDDQGWGLSNEELSKHDVPAHTVFRRFDDAPIPYWLSLVWRRHEQSPLVPLLLAIAREVRDGVAATSSPSP